MIRLIIFYIFIIISNKTFPCSPIEKLNYEEVIVQSDNIFIGTVVGFREKGEEKYALVEIDKVLKTHEKNKRDHLDKVGFYQLIKGNEVTKNLNNRDEVPYKKNRRTAPGKCFSYNYEYGSTYLFILKDKTPYWAPLNPVNEKIKNEKDPWVIWVEGFLAGINFNKYKNN